MILAWLSIFPSFDRRCQYLFWCNRKTLWFWLAFPVIFRHSQDGISCCQYKHVSLTRRRGVHDVGCHFHGAFLFLPIDQCAVILSVIHLLQATNTFAIGLDGSNDCHLSFQQPTGRLDGDVESITWYVTALYINLISQTCDKTLYEIICCCDVVFIWLFEWFARIRWRVEGLIQWFEEQLNGSCSFILETIFSGADITRSDVWTEKVEKFDWHCYIENLMPILRRKTCCYVMKIPIDQPPNIPKPNGCFDLSFVGFVSIRWHNLLLSLCYFEWRMLLLIDWLLYVTIIWIIFSSMNVAHAESRSTTPRNSGLTPSLFEVLNWNNSGLEKKFLQKLPKVSVKPSLKPY